MGKALFGRDNFFSLLGLGKRKHAIDILEELTIGDFLVAHLFSGRSTSRMYKIAREKAWQRYRAKKEIERLEREGLVKKNRRGSETVLQITRRGREALDHARRQTVQEARIEASWDGKWRMVTFDFPEKKRNVRNAVRYLLKKHGYYQAQKNVWMHPYDLKETTAFLRDEPQARDHVSIHVIEKTSFERLLRQHFKSP